MPNKKEQLLKEVLEIVTNCLNKEFSAKTLQYELSDVQEILEILLNKRCEDCGYEYCECEELEEE